MPDNVTAPAAGVAFATDEQPGTPAVHWPFAKLAFGADGTFTRVADADGARLPVLVYVQPGQAIALDAATLAALENIQAAVTGTVALDSATLTALETITIGAALPAGNNNIGDVDVASLPVTGTTTRTYSLANAIRVAFTATSTAEAALPTLGASREIRFAASARCWVKWGATGLTAAAAEAASLVLEANSPEVIAMPAGATHFRVIRDSADGNLLMTPVA